MAVRTGPKVRVHTEETHVAGQAGADMAHTDSRDVADRGRREGLEEAA